MNRPPLDTEPWPSMATLTAAILLATLFAALLAIFGPALDDHSAERQQAADLQAAQQQAQVVKRFERAAQDICGREAAAWELLADGAIQCRTKYGRKTVIARVAL